MIMNNYCNITVGYINLPPYLQVDIKDGKMFTEKKRFQPFISVANTFGQWFRYTKHVDVTRQDMHSNEEVEVSGHPYSINYNTSFRPILPPFGESSVRTVSMMPVPEREYVDLIEFYLILPIKFWLSMMLMWTLLTMICLLFKEQKSNSIKVKCLPGIAWFLVQILLRQNHQQLQVYPRRINLLAIWFCFFISAYFSAIYSTNYVVEKKPFTIDSLQDLIDERASKYMPIFRRNSLIFDQFLKSDSHLKQKVAQMTINNGLHQSIIDDDFTLLPKLIAANYRRPLVGIVNKYVAELLSLFLCRNSVYDFHGNRIKMHIGKNSISRDLVTQHLKPHNDSCKEYKEKKASQTLYYYTEYGHALNLLTKVAPSLPSDDPFEVWQCSEEEKVSPFHFNLLTIKNMKKFLFCFVILLTISCVCLLAELIHCCLWSFKSVKFVR